MADRFRGRFARGLVAYLVLALLPAPIITGWLLSGTSTAATDEEKAVRVPSLTDIAPRQPRLAFDPSEVPAERLRRLGLEPRLPSEADQEAMLALQVGDTEKAVEQHLEQLAEQLGGRAQAEALIARIEGPVPETPRLMRPRLNPEVPDPFVPLPNRATYKRSLDSGQAPRLSEQSP